MCCLPRARRVESHLSANKEVASPSVTGCKNGPTAIRRMGSAIREAGWKACLQSSSSQVKWGKSSLPYVVATWSAVYGPSSVSQEIASPSTAARNDRRDVVTKNVSKADIIMLCSVPFLTKLFRDLWQISLLKGVSYDCKSWYQWFRAYWAPGF